MATQTVSRPLDVDLERDKYFEFIDGQYVQRVIGSKPHCKLQFRILCLLKPIAQSLGSEAWQEWTIARGEEWLIPDVAFTFLNRAETDGRGYLVSTPFLCIEIVSPGQSEAELFRKCYRYSQWGVPHCWVIDPQARACFEYHGGKDFILADADGFLAAGDVRLSVSDIFVEE